MHLHLDLTGGIAGDMFTAAMLDALPELEAPLRQALAFMVSDMALTLALSDGVNQGISGKHFDVVLAPPAVTPQVSSQATRRHQYTHGHQSHANLQSAKAHRHVMSIVSLHQHKPQYHEHRSWKSIRYYIEQSPLSPAVKTIALGIFGLLAQAEAKVHQMDVEKVQFHEVGAWDCIADILSAAVLIDASEASSWSVSKLPWGGGTVQCAHGRIPVPAPATLNLLTNYEFIDDGQAGERITPTGAAILAWLAPSQHLPSGRLTHIGYGLGSRTFKNIPNILRVSVFSMASVSAWQGRITIIQCDIDDMRGELLAIARENLRQQTGVLDITESVAHGKKNRFINTLTLLCEPEYFPQIQSAIFEQTSILGIRYWTCERVTWPRQTLQQGVFTAKVAERPKGIHTCKLEADHLVASSTHQQRVELKRQMEQQLEESFTNDGQ